MKKFFTSGKFGIKNKKFASILDALLGWSFFVVSCCTALFLCFYASGSDDVAYADSNSDECIVELYGFYNDTKITDAFSNVLIDGKEPSTLGGGYRVKKNTNVNLQFTLKTGYIFDKDSDEKVQINYAIILDGMDPVWTPNDYYEDLTSESERRNLHPSETVKIFIHPEENDDRIDVRAFIKPDRFTVKFVSEKNDFNDNGCIKSDVASIKVTSGGGTDGTKIYFEYQPYVNYSITLKDGYRVCKGEFIKTYLVDSGGNNSEIKADSDGNFSISFDYDTIGKYKNSDIEILVTGIRLSSESSIRIETDQGQGESVPYFDFISYYNLTVKEWGQLNDNGEDFYTQQSAQNGKIENLYMNINQGYIIENYKVEYRKGSEINWLPYDNVIIENVYSGTYNNHPPRRLVVKNFDLEDDVVFKVSGIEFDQYNIRFYDGVVSDKSLQLNETTEEGGKERVKVFRDAEGKSLTQSDMDALSIKFNTPVYFKIEPQGNYSLSRISVYIMKKYGDKQELKPCGEEEGKNRIGYYKIHLDSSNIEDFGGKNGGDPKDYFKDYIQIVVEGISVNCVNINWTPYFGINYGDFFKNVTVSCKGENDSIEQEMSPPSGQWNYKNYLFENVLIGSDRTATIKIKLDRWYKFINNTDYEALISEVTPGEVTEKSLEKREDVIEAFGYEDWQKSNTALDVAVFKIKVPKYIKEADEGENGKKIVHVQFDPTQDSSELIEGYNKCSIEFTNEEVGLTLKKLNATSEGNKFTASETPDTDKKFSNIVFEEPNYFLVEADGFKCSLGEKVRVNGSFANCEFVDNAIVNNVAINPNQRVVRVTINDQSDNYYPGLPAEVKIGGVIVEDRFAMIDGINTEAIKEADITEFKKFEPNLDPPIKNSKTKISTGYGNPLSFVIRPASGYSFPSVGKDNIKDILSVYEIKKDSSGINPDEEENLINDYVESGKLVFENLGSSLEIRIASMLDNIYIVVNSTPDKVPINFKQSEGMECFKVDEEKVGEVNEEKIGDQLRGTVTIDKSKDYKFAVKVLDGYDFQSLKVFSNEVGISESGTLEQEGIKYHVYTLLNVEKYTNITASVEKLKCKLTFTKPPVGAYYTKSGSDKEITEQFTEDGILYGSNFSFRVKLKDEYNQSKLTVRAHGNEVQPSSDDTYTIYNITEDGTISIDDNIKLNNYTVNFESSDRAEYILEGSNGKIKNVEYGGNCKFKVRAKTGYKLGENIAVNCVGASGSESLTGKKVSGSESDAVYEYEIENITENKTISVSGVEDLFYNIKLQDVEGVTYINDTGSVISGTHKIAYGKNFEFSVNVDDAYDDSIPGMFIIVNEGKSMGVSAQKLSSGKYVIPNITQDITVRVGNIRKNRYTVTFTKTEGIDYYDTNGKIITGDAEVEQNDSISFKVSLYPAYSDSKITVMLGDKAVTADSSGVYTLTGIDENKTVTVLGVEKSKEAELINTINSLPNPVKTLDDVNLVIEASKIYNSLSDEKKKAVTNYDLLQKLQEQVKAFHHISNDVKVEGVDWYLKLVAVPISSSTEICSRIYEKLNSEYILSLYDIYLWDTLTDKRYTLPSGTTAVISIPTPDMTYFNKPTGIHENDGGKIDYLSLTFDGGRTTFEAVTFSPFGVIANRSSTPGRSSLLDAVDANVDLIKDFALSSFGGNSSDKSGISESAIFDDTNSDLQIGSEDGVEGNISEKYKSRNNKVTARGSALRLILVLMIIVLIALALWILYKRRNEMKKSKNNKNS